MVVSPPTSTFAFGQESFSGRHAHIFQPPKSPSTTATTVSHATSTDYFAPSARKRARENLPAARRQFSSSRTPRAQSTLASSWTPTYTTNETAQHGSYVQSTAFVNEKYNLAGGFDTPSLQASAEMRGPYDSYLDDHRRQTRESAWEANQREPSMPLFGPLSRERNGAARISSPADPANTSTTWTGLAFGLVGKVFNFGTNVIRGFYAGGGQGYDLAGNPVNTPKAWQPSEGCSTPLPGAWAEDDFMGDFEQDNFSSPPSSLRPPNKRRQTDKDAWVVVGEPHPDLHSQPHSPKRKTSYGSETRNTQASRPSASRASSRRTMAPTSRRMPSYGTYATGSPAQHLALESRASFAPTRSPLTHAGNLSNSGFLSPEAERYVKRQARQDKAADRAMSSMSRQLEDLIRQGQEALGTKFSVEGLDHGLETDEGFVDDD